MNKGKMHIINTPEPRPVFIELNFDPNELMVEDAFDEVFTLHDAIKKRLEGNPAVNVWGRLAPIALVGPLRADKLDALTVVGWPEDEAIVSLDEFIKSYCAEAKWTAHHRVVGPGHDEWKGHLGAFWHEGYQFDPHRNWRRD